LRLGDARAEHVEQAGGLAPLDVERAPACTELVRREQALRRAERLIRGLERKLPANQHGEHQCDIVPCTSISAAPLDRS
jgi:hypothetical protein